MMENDRYCNVLQEVKKVATEIAEEHTLFKLKTIKGHYMGAKKSGDYTFFERMLEKEIKQLEAE